MDKRLIIYGNHSEWLDFCFSSAETDNFVFYNGTFPTNSRIINALSKFVFYGLKTNFFKKALYRFFVKSLCNNLNDSKEKVLIIYDWHILANDKCFLSYVKKRFPRVKLVYLFTNIVKLSGAQKNSFVSQLSLFYDYVYAFDLGDSERYGFHYSQLIYNCPGPNYIDKKDCLYDVFYVGNAKDRLDTLHKVYSVLESLDLKLEFNICGVSNEKQVHGTGINYNQYLHYVDIVEKIKKSKCIVDIIQGDSQGLTIKVCEAVIFDKLLITTNKNIVTQPFYNKDYILVIDDNCVIDRTFFNNYEKVKYSSKDKHYFSLLRFEEQLSNDLENFNY